MAESSALDAFWGPITSSTEWCESNYVVSRYVAEFYNTISNIPGFILALIGLINSVGQRFEKRFTILYLSTMVLCIGSALFHATLQYAQQQSDETPMVWVMLLYIYIIYSPDWHYKSTMPTVLFIYGSVFAVLHSQFRFVISFQIHYLFLALLCLPRMYKYYILMIDRSAKRLVHMCIFTMVLGAAFWLVDRALCHKLVMWRLNPQGHAWWHLLMGFNSYYANTFLQYCRARQLNWSPRLCYLGDLLPYVKISKPSKPSKLSKPSKPSKPKHN